MLKSSYFFTFFLFCNLFSFITLLSGDSSNKQIVSTQSNDLMNSNYQEQASKDGLYDNGPLGRGFIERSLDAQKREVILETTRNNNHQAELQDQENSTMFKLLKKRNDLYNRYKHVIEGDKKVPEGTLGFTKLSEIALQEHPESECTLNEYLGYLVYNTINEQIESLYSYNYYSNIIRFNPIVLEISSAEKSENCPFLVRVALHQLRQKVEKPSLHEKTRINLILREYLKKYPEGIEVSFTDGYKVDLCYDNGRITYTPIIE